MSSLSATSVSVTFPVLMAVNVYVTVSPIAPSPVYWLLFSSSTPDAGASSVVTVH